MHARRAEQLVVLGRPKEALRAARRASELQPANFLAWYVMASIAATSGDFDRACSCARRSLRTAPRHPSEASMHDILAHYGLRARILLASSEAARHRYGEACAVAQDALTLTPECMPGARAYLEQSLYEWSGYAPIGGKVAVALRNMAFRPQLAWAS